MSSNSSEGKLVLNAKETADKLGISTRLLWSETKAGNVPHVRIGGRVVYPVAELMSWLENQAEKSVK